MAYNQEILNLIDSDIGYIQVNHNYAYNGTYSFDMPNVFGTITKIKFIYGDVEFLDNCIYYIMKNNETFLEFDNKYCQMIEILSDQKFKKEINFKQEIKQKVVYEIKTNIIYSEYLRIVLYIRNSKFKKVPYIEVYGLLKVSENKNYQIKSYKYKEYSKFSDIELLHLEPIKNIIIGLANDNYFNPIEMIRLSLTIKNISYTKIITRENMEKILIKNNLNSDSNIYLIDLSDEVKYDKIKLFIDTEYISNIYEYYIYIHYSLDNKVE